MGNASKGLLAVVGIFVAMLLGVVMMVSVLGGGQDANAALLLKPGSVPAPYVQWVQQAGTVCKDITAPLIAAQIEAESGWDPNNHNSLGASGLAQFIYHPNGPPTAWDTFGKDVNGNGVTSPFDPPDAILAQAHYMCSLVDTMRRWISEGKVHGDPVDLALAGYNAGAYAVLKYGGIPPFKETQNYVPKIKGLMGKYAAAPTIGAGAPAAGPFGLRVVAYAQRLLGTPYDLGAGGYYGPTNGHIDCSGLSMYAVYQASGGKIRLPHFAGSQVPYGHIVPANQAAAGDLIFFHSPGDTPGRQHHVVIYIGNGMVVHAPDYGIPVRQQKLWHDSDVQTVVRYG
jgi:hypothetical protein